MRLKRSARKLRGGSNVAEHMYRELPVKIKGNIVYRAKLAAIFLWCSSVRVNVSGFTLKSVWGSQ